MAMMVNVDPFEVPDPSELPDWRLPLSFMKSRHLEEIQGEEPTEDSWRIKDRVREGGEEGGEDEGKRIVPFCPQPSEPGLQ